MACIPNPTTIGVAVLLACAMIAMEATANSATAGTVDANSRRVDSGVHAVAKSDMVLRSDCVSPRIALSDAYGLLYPTVHVIGRFTFAWIRISDCYDVPASIVPPVISGTPHVGRELSCSQGTWSDNPTSYSYRWRRSGSTIEGATSSTYTLVGADADNEITCRVTATNSKGSASAISIGIMVVGVPSNTLPPSISGTSFVGHELSCWHGTWIGATSYNYQWLRDGAPIPRATSPAYALVEADVGYEITCSVTATNEAGSATRTSAAVTVLEPETPEAPEPPVSDTTAPITTIDSGPATAIRQLSAVFTFHANESGVGFECRTDSRPWGPCGSPEIVYGLALGSHTFQVRAQDWAGNTGEPAGWNWVVDREAPDLMHSNLSSKKGKKDLRLRRARLTSFNGLVGDDADVKRVKVKLKIVNPRKKSKKGMCASLSLRTGHRLLNKCKLGFASVKGTRRWRIALSKKVRSRLKIKDHYCLLVRTLDSVGNQKTHRVYFRVS